MLWHGLKSEESIPIDYRYTIKQQYVATNMKNQIREQIEVYHRAVKQTCGIERCQARTPAERRDIISFLLLLLGFNNIKYALPLS